MAEKSSKMPVAVKLKLAERKLAEREQSEAYKAALAANPPPPPPNTAEPRTIVLDEDGALYAVKRREPREYIYVEAAECTKEELEERLGFSIIYRQCLASGKKSTHNKKETEVMAKNKKTAKASKATPKTDQLRKLREQQQEAAPKTQEVAKDAKKQQGETKAKSKAEKPAQAKPKSSKAAPKSEAVKTVESSLSEQKTSKQVASSRNVFGFSIAAILRWMGDNAISEEQAKRALASYKIDPMPKDRSVKHYLDYKNNPKCMGAVPDLTKAQASEIKNRAKE